MPDIPQTFGKYQIRGELGRGGFATVYRAHDPTLDRDLALKVLAPHLTWDPDFAARFHQEAKVAASLSHPNIITVYEIGELEGNLFIAMELVEGGSLREYLEQHGRMSPSESVELLAPVAEALDFAHSKGLVHRDIKPANILLKPMFRARMLPILTDFGLVKAISASSSLTASGAVLGTVEYMAPEQADAARADEIGPATDLYALSVVAYHMLTGQVPFAGSTIQVLMAHASKAPLSPSAVRADLPQQVSEIILRGLAKLPGERFASAAEFINALRQAAAPAPIAAPTMPTAAPVTPTLAPAELAAPAAPTAAPVQRLTPQTSAGSTAVAPDVIVTTPPLPTPVPSPKRRALPLSTLLAGAAILLLIGVIGIAFTRGRVAPTPAPIPAPTEGAPTPAPTATTALGAPIVVTWSVFPPEVVKGQTVTIQWEVLDAGEVFLEPFGKVEAQGKITDAPSTATTYTLTAHLGDQKTVREQRVVVKEPTPGAPVIAEFQVSPSEIVQGQVSVVSVQWAVTTAYGTAPTVRIEPGLGNVEPKGQKEIPAPGADTIYRLTATSDGSESVAEAKVIVQAPLCRVVTGTLNLRSGPGTIYEPPVLSMLRNTRLTPLAYFAGGFPETNWIQARIETGEVGWVRVRSAYIECNIEMANLPAAVDIPPTPTSTPTITPAPTPTATPTPDVPLGFAITHFVGSWVNADTSTTGMTRLDITKVNDTTLTFHGYGKCTPSDCDWGEVTAPFTPPLLTGVYTYSYKTTKIIAERSGAQLIVTVIDDYTAADGRTDRTSIYTMNKRLRVFDPSSSIQLATPVFQLVLPTPAP